MVPLKSGYFAIVQQDGGVCTATERGIFDLYVCKQLALRLATDAAITVLRVDQVCHHALDARCC
jgi:chaperonin GroEL (HSP60 family)